MSDRSIVIFISVAAASALALSACREDEQGRLLSYQKGVYLGAPDRPLGAERTRELRQRTAYQGGPKALSGRQFPVGRRDVRPPVNLGALRLRGTLQGGR